MVADKPQNEAERVEALRAYRVLDTAAEAAYDDITRMAAFICGTPIAVVTLIDADRQWFKSRVGLDATETPRELAFCAHTILGREALVVEDATADARFADHPLVTGGPGIRFYAGAPLTTDRGLGLGALCVVDMTPRRLSADQLSALSALSRQVVALLEHRRVAASLAAALEQVKALSSLVPMCAWCKCVRKDDGYWQRVEEYIRDQTGGKTSHAISPACFEGMKAEYACGAPEAGK